MKHWDNLEMIVAVPWRKNEDEEKVDEERLKGGKVLMDKDHKERMEMEEHVPVAKGVHVSRESGDVRVYINMSWMLVNTESNSEATSHRELSKKDGTGVAGHHESELLGCSQTRERTSG